MHGHPTPKLISVVRIWDGCQDTIEQRPKSTFMVCRIKRITFTSHACSTCNVYDARASTIRLNVCMLKCVLDLVRSSLANAGKVDWSKIASLVSRHVGDPECMDVHALVRWTQQWGGLPYGRFIADLTLFHTAYVPSGRRIPSSTFGALAELRLGPDELCPFFVSAVLKAQATCPPNKVCSRVCRFITGSDIAALQGSKKQMMLRAEALISITSRMLRDM